MSETATTRSKPAENGFELAGEFYRWHVSDVGKDLMLIDRIAGMPITEFFETIEDDFDRSRAPILLALIATSVRHGHPDWTVDRIARLVMNVNLSDVEFVDVDAEEDDLPPTSANGQAPSTGDSSASESRSTSSETTPEPSEMFNATPG